MATGQVLWRRKAQESIGYFGLWCSDGKMLDDAEKLKRVFCPVMLFDGKMPDADMIFWCNLECDTKFSYWCFHWKMVPAQLCVFYLKMACQWSERESLQQGQCTRNNARHLYTVFTHEFNKNLSSNAGQKVSCQRTLWPFNHSSGFAKPKFLIFLVRVA